MIYNAKSKNNIIKLQLVLLDGTIYTFDKEIIFNKVGEISSIDGKWSCVIRPVDPEATTY